MSAADDREQRLERAVAGVYDGPLEEFVRRRDTLVKELRTAGERDAAAAVKGLRKPSRIAWALNLGVLGSASAIDPLVAAVAGTLEAQAAGGDVRAAIAALRGRVRDFAGEAADAAEHAGYRVEPGMLANAVLAVIGRPESFDQLRGGRLVDVPEAGGLDFLATLPAPSGSPATNKAREVAAAPATSSDPARADATAHDAARRAAGVLAEARSRSETAQRALREAESKLQAAEERARQADEDVRAARAERERAREEAGAAVARLREAEREFVPREASLPERSAP